jgi:acetylornithine/succinyldiaminopimelate/putrescine aminotransferase
VTAGNTIRLLPPLVINNNEANEIVKLVSELVIDFLNSQPVESE